MNSESSVPPVILAETRFLRLIQDGLWTYVQRPNVTGAIAIVAVTTDAELILVEQYRIPTRAMVIELPAGLVGDLDEQTTESPEQAAERELLEETGYIAGRWARLTHAVSSAGLTDESVHLLRAYDLECVGPGGGDASESIHVHRVPLSHVLSWLQAQQAQGKLIDYKVFAGLYFLAAEQE